MTLVVGRVIDGQIYMLGDTALTYYNSAPANPTLDGCLKQYIVSDTITIGFAGEQVRFEEDLGRLLASQTADEVVAIAVASQLAGKAYDLMVGEIGYPNLRIVRDAHVVEAPAGFVGDPTAFEAYQKAFHTRSQPMWLPEANKATIQILRLPEPIQGNQYHRLFNSLRDVITDPAIESVGGILVSLCSDNGRFRYVSYTDITSDILNLEDFGPEPKVIEFGTDAGGGYAMDFEDDMPRGGSGLNIGVYFLQGGFGVIFPDTPSRLRRPQIVRAANPAFWTLHTEKLLGHGIPSAFTTPDHCGIAGDELLHCEQWQEAHLVYQLNGNLGTFEDRPDLLEQFVTGRSLAMFNVGQHEQAIAELTQFAETHTPAIFARQWLAKFAAARAM